MIDSDIWGYRNLQGANRTKDFLKVFAAETGLTEEDSGLIYNAAKGRSVTMSKRLTETLKQYDFFYINQQGGTPLQWKKINEQLPATIQSNNQNTLFTTHPMPQDDATTATSAAEQSTSTSLPSAKTITPLFLLGGVALLLSSLKK